jgi:hypothetical protein
MSLRVLEPARRTPRPRSAAPTSAASPVKAPDGHELLAVRRRAPAIEVGAVDDPLERAADRVADRALRRCACGGIAGPDGECARCKAARLAGRPVAPPLVHRALDAPWAPLDASTRAYFEPRLGADLSAVRVHRDATAAASADAVGALAYTVGADVVFAADRYAPGTGAGRRLIAHELAHVLQQRTGTALVQRQAPPPVTPTCNTVPFDPLTQHCCDDRVIAGPATPGDATCRHRTTRDIEYDGCSLPDLLNEYLAGPGATEDDKDNPGGAHDTWFSDRSIHGTQTRDYEPTLPCDVHDKCYQTCGTNRVACDDALFAAGEAVCRNSMQRGERFERCLAGVERARTLLPPFSQAAFDQRQQEYCACCPPPQGRFAALVRFDEGESELDVYARKSVEDFVALNRALLTDPKASLLLVGHASRLGSDADNQALSADRVTKVREAIDDALGLEAIQATIVPDAKGAALAAVEVPGDPTDDSPEHRVVQIILTGPY